MTSKDLFQRLLTPFAKDDLDSLDGKPLENATSEEGEAQAKPRFLQAAEGRAARLGISPPELLASYAQRIKESKYPTSDCLTTEEVQAYASGSSLSVEQSQHIETCESCRKLLESARPDIQLLAPLLEEVRLLAVRATVQRGLAKGSAEAFAEQPSLSSSAQMFDQSKEETG